MASTLNATDSPAAPPPVTPERGRARTRYPSHLTRDLDAEGKPRPFLHRRGTSHTYETLEDLLKEAGYKETRVFTPEMERREAEREERREREARGEQGGVGVSGAVAKLFSTWMSGSRRHGQDAHDDDVRIPSSPLAHRAPMNAPVLRLDSPPRSSASSVTLRPQHLTRAALSASSVSTLHPSSKARLALRHAVSAPNIDKSRRRPPRRSRPKAPPPPLPSTWLESISAALLSPRMLPTPPSSPSAPRIPAILTQRAHTSLGAVSITTVVCRSASPSRSPSTVRSPRLVPTLAQTCVCEERWPPHSPHRLPAPAPGAPPEDDEDDELDLSTLLIPAKRQHSIRSLRSVLLQHSYSSVPARRRIAETDACDGHWDSGEFLSARVKRRRGGLPGTWGWTSSSRA